MIKKLKSPELHISKKKQVEIMKKDFIKKGIENRFPDNYYYWFINDYLGTNSNYSCSIFINLDKILHYTRMSKIIDGELFDYDNVADMDFILYVVEVYMHEYFHYILIQEHGINKSNKWDNIACKLGEQEYLGGKIPHNLGPQ